MYVPRMGGLPVVAEVRMLKKWVWPKFLPLSPTPGSDPGIWWDRIEEYTMMCIYYKYEMFLASGCKDMKVKKNFDSKF